MSEIKEQGVAGIGGGPGRKNKANQTFRPSDLQTFRPKAVYYLHATYSEQTLDSSGIFYTEIKEMSKQSGPPDRRPSDGYAVTEMRKPMLAWDRTPSFSLCLHRQIAPCPKRLGSCTCREKSIFTLNRCGCQDGQIRFCLGFCLFFAFGA